MQRSGGCASKKITFLRLISQTLDFKTFGQYQKIQSTYQCIFILIVQRSGDGAGKKSTLLNYFSKSLQKLYRIHIFKAALLLSERVA